MVWQICKQTGEDSEKIKRKTTEEYYMWLDMVTRELNKK